MLKSDQNGIETSSCEHVLEARRGLKSDQNGIETCIRRIYLDIADELKSDQNGIETEIDGKTVEFTLVKIRPKWD